MGERGGLERGAFVQLGKRGARFLRREPGERRQRFELGQGRESAGQCGGAVARDAEEMQAAVDVPRDDRADEQLEDLVLARRHEARGSPQASEHARRLGELASTMLERLALEALGAERFQ